MRLGLVENPASSMSRKRSPAELKTREWYPLGGSNSVVSRCRRDAFPSGAGSVNWCSWQASNPHFPAFKAGPLPVGLHERGVRSEIRTPTERVLNPLPLPLG